jgi:hypothetical protein
MKETSEKIARLMGPTLMVIAASVLFNRKSLPDMAAQISYDWSIVFLSGLVLFVAGLAIVTAHNVWERGWQRLVTLLGWLAMIGGAARVLYPKQLAAVTPFFVQSQFGVFLAAYALLALGAFLTLKGFRLLD